ncbi:Serine/threonine-protein kinase STY46 (Serine/threonine/tyrosine-protein kinase 46) [Durusdinium trenchii]|uniref:Serine/threonine-protein kinase STY46 (Serine/threonine/tyrosine-protein kinase 46) n=1 Tax=Durusdinium trenchii TaxID=1381693 RepID=A0ABP0RZE7_9DINO
MAVVAATQHALQELEHKHALFGEQLRSSLATRIGRSLSAVSEKMRKGIRASKVAPQMPSIGRQAPAETVPRVVDKSAKVLKRMFTTTPVARARGVDDWKILPKQIRKFHVVASGSFGDVYRGEYEGAEVAIKTPARDIDPDMLEKFAVEIELMTQLHHPNIVRFIGACVDGPDKFLVIEFLENGSLHDFLVSPRAEALVDYPRIIRFSIDIARAMRYLHSRANIIQRDLKSRNILLDESLNCKVCDFGLSRFSEEDHTMTACGTPFWVAPEIVLGEKYDGKADVFSFAIVMWELHERKEPYEGRPGLDTAIEVAQRGN